jgi:glycosyltransferase involved in cell wall biosynthesis
MKIAVMMAAHDAARHIGDALASLLRQSDAADLDIIVVNDGSTDGTGEIVRALAAPQIRLFDQENRGVTPTRNALLSAMAPDTDFVTVLDADDLCPAGRLARDLGHFRADPSLDLVFGESLLFRSTGTDRLEPDFSAPTLRVRGVQMGAGLYRHELIRRTGRFDESFSQAEDLDFMFRMLEQNPRFRVIDDLSYYYRRHSANMTHDGRTLHRSVARAILMAAERKSSGRLPPFPQGFFDMKDYAQNPGW